MLNLADLSRLKGFRFPRSVIGYAAVMQVRSCAMPCKGMATGPSRSFVGQILRKASKFYRGGGLSSEHSLGLGGADASLKTGKPQSKARPRGATSQASASCPDALQGIAMSHELLSQALCKDEVVLTQSI